jgi:uncharacterized protein YjbI with pentapeptide repeats
VRTSLWRTSARRTSAGQTSSLAWADLSEAKLIKANLGGLKGRFSEALNVGGAFLRHANLAGADLSEAKLIRADLIDADLRRANLSGADLDGATLLDANLSRANLSGADLQSASLVNTNLTDANLTGCRIFGLAAWNIKLKGATQQNLVITPLNEPEITVDDIEVAQFVYLMLQNEKIRRAIDTITDKAVLILGRFTEERKPVLEALRQELRQRKYLPILFDFDKPGSLSRDETITLLARMARFVIADISDAKSVLQELRGIVPDLPSVPVQPIILATQEEPGMFDFFKRYPWFLQVHRYKTPAQLLADLDQRVIAPADAEAVRLRT